jgi:alpha-glucosidase
LDLRVRVFASETATDFRLYEDDGVTESYQSGAVAETPISQGKQGSVELVTIGKTSGDYTGKPVIRQYTVELVLESEKVSGVSLNGSALPFFAKAEDFDRCVSGWYVGGDGVIYAKSPQMSADEDKIFQFSLL